ncbi:MAG: InlB B-repeat-containing protein, partial [Nocardiaceae bacterium]|nr:InlB B-repeat-containing protein [Nocardiaceae bacterium]
TATYSSNGHGATTPTGATPSYGDKLTAPTATWTGHHITGWNTASDGTGTTWNFGTDTVTADVTLYAQWAVDTFTVTYDSNGHGATTPASATPSYGDKLTPPTAIWAGHHIIGWNTASDSSGTDWDFGADTVTTDLTLYAQWAADSVPATVTYDGNGHGPVTPETSSVTVGDLVTDTPTATWMGHHITGWNTAADGTGTAWSFGTDPVTSDVTLYAQWAVDTFTATYDGNGHGSVTPGSVTSDYGTTISAPATSGYTGHHVASWNTATGGTGTTWDFASSTMTADVTLYAQWAIDTHTVTFDDNNHGSVTSGSLTSDYGSTISQPSATWTGHHITGWNTASDGTGTTWNFTNDTVTADVTLYAQWAIDTHTVTFDGNSHDTVTPASATTDYGSTVSEPSATWPGHHITGWNTASDGTGATWNFDTNTVTADTTLYAQWTVDTFTVSFDSNGGSSVSDQSVDYGTSATQPAVPARAGYTFDGWYVGGTAYDWGTAVTGPVALVAHWTAIPPGGQNIVFLPPTVLLSGAGAVSLTATSSAGLPVDLALMSGACSLDGASLTASADTSCTIVAAQPGNDRWLAADPVIRTIQFVSPVDDTASMASPTTGPKSIDIPVMANDPAGITLAGAGSPEHGATAARGGEVGYTPAATFQGTDTFTYQVSDVLGRTATADVSVVVADAPPTVTGGTIKQLQGTTQTVTVTTADPNGDPVSLSATSAKAVDTSIRGSTVSISPDDTVSGWVTVVLTADDGAGGVGTSTIRSLVRPRPVTSVTRRLQDDGTMVSWPQSDTKDARYEVFVDDTPVCTTSEAQCLIGQVLGPDFTVKVQVLGLDGTTSTKTTAVATGHRQVLLRTVYFDPGVWTLGKAQFHKLVTVGSLIRRLGFHHAHVSGYTDSDGGAQYNLNLSKQRTQLVVKELWTTRRITSQEAWFGYNKPAASNDTAAGKSLNRRVEILVSY